MDRLIQIWGSVHGIAAALGRPVPTVYSWSQRGIPMKRFPEIIRAAAAAGHVLTFDDLLAANQQATPARGAA